MIKKIAFVTGGGDCAGINAFIAAATRKGMEKYGVEFVGIRKAFAGATDDQIEKHLVPLRREEILGLENKPSTILESSRFNPFSEENKAQKRRETRGEPAQDWRGRRPGHRG